MNVPVAIPAERLPALIDRAASALLNARTSAEVLDARDMASTAYAAAKTAGRMARAKEAHDTILAEVYRAQADALLIEARAKMRLADEYDAAQAAGEVSSVGQQRNVGGDNVSTAADLGLRRDEIHDARRLRDAEAADPGRAERIIDDFRERGEEPTKAVFRREMIETPKPKTMNPKALWLWGRIKDFDRMGILGSDPGALLTEMTEPMRQDVRRYAPQVRAFLEALE